ncbi:MAG: hypothetical protein ACT4PE_15990 [Candidatus Eiseniibacteriota bacterium]
MWKRWWAGRQDREGAAKPAEAEPSVARKGREPRSAEDDALLDRIASAVVRFGMSVPAVFLLESSKPLNFVGSQFLHFLSPIVGMVLRADELDRFALLLERRDTAEEMIRRIEAAEAVRASQGSAGAARKKR